MKRILIILTSFISIVSCTERIDLGDELANDIPRIAVVEAFIGADTTTHKVYLTWSKDLDNDQAADPITGALINITGNGQDIVLTEVEPGEYHTPSDYYVVPNQRYYLTINNVDTDDDGDFDLITATDSVPTQPLLDSIQVDWIDQWEAWRIKAFAQENGAEENYYMFNVYINDTLLTDTLNEITLSDDYLINGIYINGLEVDYLQAEYQDEILYDNDKVTLEICGISEDAFEFLLQAQNEVGYSAPLFSGPPSNVDHIIQGENVFGAFVVYSNHKVSHIWKE